MSGGRGRFVRGLVLGLLSALVTSQAAAEPRAESPPGGIPERELRRALLIENLKRDAGRAPLERWGPAVMGTLFVGLGIGAAIGEMDEDRSGELRGVAIGTSGALVALNFSSYLVAEDYRGPVFGGGNLALMGLGGGAFFWLNPYSTTATRITFTSLMGSAVLSGALAGLDAALERPVSAMRLERHLDRLQRPGENLSPSELRAIELDLSRMQRPIPRFVYPLTMVTGGLVGATPALSKRTSPSDRELAASFSALWILSGTVGLVTVALTDPSYQKYTEALRSVRLAPIGPESSTGLSAAWRF